MRHVPTLLRRELGAYFLSPMAYLILLAFQVIAWMNFYDLVESLSRPQRGFSGLSDPMNSYISGSYAFWIALMVALPSLTMRLLAEERRAGTIEGLLTVPVSEAEVVVAKWLAGLAMYWALLLPFAIYLPVLAYYGNYGFDLGPVAALAIGLTTLGMMFTSIGVFFSSMTRNQVVAAICTFVVMFLLIMVTSLGYSVAESRRSGWAEVIRFVSVLFQVHNFGGGQLDLRFLALHLSATVFMLYLTIKILQSRRGV